jgi:hypothetical protein
MKKIRMQILLGLLALASARADTPLSVGVVPLIIPGGPCWDDTLIYPPAPSASNSFTLTEVSGSGTLNSDAPTVVDNVREQDHFQYVYSLDLSGMQAANHCVKLLIHFGPPLGCAYDVLVFTNASGGVNVSSATLAPLGDIQLLFGSGCLAPGQTATVFSMLSDTPPTTGSVTVIDDYTDPASGQNKETRVNVPAIVPNIPPPWIYPIQLPYPLALPYPIFQGSLVTNPIPMLPPSNGLYNFTFQLLDGSNGLPVSTVVTQTAPVVNGLFSAPLPFDPDVFFGSSLWLSVAVMPPNGSGFTLLNPPLPITPAPQAIYAYSAGVVAGLSAGQAVTSLDGLTDGVILQAGAGIILDTNGNTLTVSAQPGQVSDRNLKTGFMAVRPQDILARLAALPIESWRFTNEAAGVRHVGPMAQDFKAAFGLGTDDKFIAFVDGQGVALAAIQGLNQKLKEKEEEIQNLKENNEALADRLNELETTVKTLAERNAAP